MRMIIAIFLVCILGCIPSGENSANESSADKPTVNAGAVSDLSGHTNPQPKQDGNSGGVGGNTENPHLKQDGGSSHGSGG